MLHTEYRQALSKVRYFQQEKLRLEQKTVRELRAIIMQVHRKNGVIFSNPVVQSVLALEQPKRWSNCRKAEMIQLIRHWYDVKITQAQVQYWVPGYFKYSENVKSQRAEIDSSGTFNWTVYFSVSTRKEAYVLLAEIAPQAKVAQVRRSKVFQTKYEIKAWMPDADFLSSWLKLDGWMDCHLAKGYPSDGDENELQARSIELRTAYQQAQTKAELSLLRLENGGKFSKQEHLWVLNWLKNFYSPEWQHVQDLVA